MLAKIIFLGFLQLPSYSGNYTIAFFKCFRAQSSACRVPADQTPVQFVLPVQLETAHTLEQVSYSVATRMQLTRIDQWSANVGGDLAESETNSSASTAFREGLISHINLYS